MKKMAEEHTQKQPAAPFKPTISLPPRPTADHLFGGGATASPGPLTLVSSFFADGYPETNAGSFSQLLAGAMNSPLAGVATNTSDRASITPMNFGVTRSPLFTVPPGLSPSGLLTSPQSPFEMSHQQALAQVTAHAALFQSDMHGQPEFQTSKELSQNHLALGLIESTQQPMLGPSASKPTYVDRESSETSQVDRNCIPPMVSVDKPAEDGYNWRKYGQKQVKGCEFPRSYYKCTHLNCPVKKKVERSLDGRITEIIYKGQHNHETPQPNRRPKEANGLARPDQTEILNQSSGSQPMNAVPGGDLETLPASAMHPFGASGNVEANHTETKVEELDVDENNDHEPNLKRRNVEVEGVEAAASHKTVTEPRIIVQTRSEVDLLDDGYRWRKYGQKIVKGNPHPRSYYKCTFPRCNVRKHVERAAADPKAVITTYEGKHNHDVPAARKSSHTIANPDVHLVRPQKVTAERHPLLKEMDFSHDQMPTVLQLKQEKVTV